eukprot:scaffold4825_cov153-Amphora_coffeaeformis.AAC.1
MSLLYVSRCLTTSQLKTLQKRFLSGQGSAALNKFRGVFEEYRLQKYSQETPDRFKKEILRAVMQDEFITPEALERVLFNIGVVNKISQEEIEIILDDFGQSGYITADRLIMIIHDGTAIEKDFRNKSHAKCKPGF